jgi:hypothetical protein
MPSLRPELLKLLPQVKHQVQSTAALVLDQPSDVDHDPSETNTITKADAKLIAEALREEIQAGSFERYRKNSLTFMPPFPKETSSEAYTRLYIKMLESPAFLSDEIRIKLWILISLEASDPTLKDKIIRDTLNKIDDTYELWEKEADKKALTLVQLVNEEKSS